MTISEMNLELQKSLYTMAACEAIFEQDFMAALHAYDQYIALDPDDFHGYDGKATTLHLLSREEEELEVRKQQLVACDKAISNDAGNVAALQNKASLLIYFTRIHDALAIYDQILRLDPQNWIANRQKGALLEEIGQSELAAPFLAQAQVLEEQAKQKMQERQAFSS